MTKLRTMLIDTHCHVSFPAYAGDADGVLARAREAGVEKMITVGTRLETSRGAVASAEAHEGVWAVVGLYPGHIHAQEFADPYETETVHPAETLDVDAYRALLAHPKTVGLGESGLDYSRVPDGLPFERMRADQQDVLRALLALASETNKPMVIHCRGGEGRASAHDDLIALLREEIGRGGLAKRGVIHCFTGSAEEAAAYRALGFFVGIGGIVTFGKSVMEAVKDIPLEQIVLETDAPYLTPAPHRGKRNEPAFVGLVAEAVARIKRVPLEEVERVTTANAQRLFGL